MEHAATTHIKDMVEMVGEVGVTPWQSKNIYRVKGKCRRGCIHMYVSTLTSTDAEFNLSFRYL